MKRAGEICNWYPFLVYERNDEIMGYAYACRQKERAAYQWNVELSIYIKREDTTKGIKTKLYFALLELLKLQNIQNVYSLITILNERSRSLHKKFGFQELGIYLKTGYKNGQWLDVLWMGTSLREYKEHPNKIITIGEIKQEQIEKYYKKR